MNKKTEVVVVDDEWIIREGIRKLFDWEKYGCELTGEAADGAEAIAVVKEKNPDILIIDINLPILSGLKVIRQLKERQRNLDIIVISGYDDFKYCQEALKLQVVDYLLKPIDYEELGQVIRRLQIKRLGKQMEESQHAGEDKLIYRIIRYIREHAGEEISLEVLSQEFHVGGAYISKIFKQETGMNYHAYLTRIRMDQAKQLLLNTSSTVTEIADAVGFRDYRVFIKSFKDREGMTPKEFQSRKENEEN